MRALRRPVLPWYCATIMSFTMLMYLSLNTFPAYAICLHMEAPATDSQGLLQARAAGFARQACWPPLAGC
jgi:hypothetical protein